MSTCVTTLLFGGVLLAPAVALAGPPPPPDVPDDEPEPVIEVDDDAPPPPTATSPERRPPPPDDSGETNDDSKETDDEDKRSPFKSDYLTIEGYVQPQYTYRVRRGARPRDQQEFGAQQTRAGLIFKGNVLPKWSYRTHFVVGSQITQVVSGIESADYEGDGTEDSLRTRSTLVPGVDLEQLWVNYRPVEYTSESGMEVVQIDIRLGQMRVPFSKQNKTQNNSLLFPRRTAAVTSFVVGSDLGAEVEVNLADERVSLIGGVFNGTGLAINRDNRRGPLWAARLEIAPLGPVGNEESDLERRSKPGFSVGSGILWSPTRLFDSDGNDTLTRSRGLLVSAFTKFAYYGFLLQSEFIRRQVTDNLSDRPFISTGAYGQLSFVIPKTETFFIAPVGRFGWVGSEQAVEPLNRYYTSDGLALFLPNKHRLDAIRVALLYQAEWFVDEGVSAQGGTMQVQLKF